MDVVSRSGDGYSAVGAREDGTLEVHLAPNHPGLADPTYRARRAALAGLALAWSPGEPLPEVEYSDEEHQTWRTVCAELRPAWAASATRSFLDGVEELRLPADRVPQLSEVGRRLGEVTGFRYQPVAGLAPLRTFYRSFGDGVFWSTQYLRHHSRPLYTPEPDLCHEVLGHAHQLADPRFAALYRRVAATVARLETQEALAFLSKVFWFSMEFGVVWEQGELRTYGAGLLSSFGELGAFRDAEVRDLDWAEMGTLSYDITRYQPVLYAARGVDEVVDRLAEFLDGFDDDEHGRLVSFASGVSSASPRG
jgi:phenylalanine-4-hydroxylase